MAGLMRLPREIKLLWALLGAVQVAVLVTYWRLPAHLLYNVTGTGPTGGLSRALVELNFPDALIALGVLGVVGPWLPRRTVPLALVAAALCAVVVIPGVVSPSHLDARWINAVPAAGVLLAFALSLLAGGPKSPRWAPGDRLRIAIVSVLVLAAAPWIAAELGFYLVGIPGLDRIFQTGDIVAFRGGIPHPVVHHGVHHGMQGLLLATSALLLSRLPRPRVLDVYLALMLAYGVGNMLNDGSLEQIAERGWTTRTFPDVLQPTANWGWLAVLGATLAIWALWFRKPGARLTARPRTPVPFARRS